MGIDITVLYREDATEEDILDTFQHLVDTGIAWHLEGTVGRCASEMIQSGAIMLGETPQRDYYGHVVPSRWQIVPGSPGSPEYAERMREEAD